MNAYIRVSKGIQIKEKALQYTGFLEIDGCIEIQTAEERSASIAVKSLNRQIVARRFEIPLLTLKNVPLVIISEKQPPKSPPKKRGRKPKEQQNAST